jgi:hypothetical protein
MNQKFDPPTQFTVVIIEIGKKSNCDIKKAKAVPKSPGVAQRVPGGLDSQISMPFGT